MKKVSSIMVLLMLISISRAGAQTINADSTKQAFTLLAQIKTDLLNHRSYSTETISTMLELGMWEEAYPLIIKNRNRSADDRVLLANYFTLNNEFRKAEDIVDSVLKHHHKNDKALLLKSFLEIQAWRLPGAYKIAQKVIENDKKNEKAILLSGKIKLLQKDYKTALIIAQRVEQQNPGSAGAYLLEAEVYFWNQQPEKAEQPLIKSLELDPFNADARFSYGYAIWRKKDAAQLDKMAAQWELALALNPLHYQTHWHWGNGHTNLTYADYAESDDAEVNKALAAADDLVRKRKIAAALKVTRNVAIQYPHSVLPLMYRASIYYSDFNMDRKTRLDSAGHIFKTILSIKKHYGPAHNGLSAVIKSKRIPFLDKYDAVTAKLKSTKIADIKNFKQVFPDVDNYTSQTVRAMVWNQLYSSVVYFSFLSRQGNTFKIPALHVDLATALNEPAFRYMTTFDNRQWMDIRGVGSGAAAIEYVERGAYMERNVLLHEYVHLFHEAVLTDAETRKIRSLYYNAMKQKRTLDYYSQNNESEYFAQTYPAYFEAVKVHPLDFKSMNTRSDLKTKDPEMYQFIDQLVKKEKAYLAGNKKAMAGNWAKVYVALSSNSGNSKIARSYLDTALAFDAGYIPAYLRMSQLNGYDKNFTAAENWLKKAENIDPAYAPIYVAYADLAAARYAVKEIDQKTAVQQQEAYFLRSLKLETDYQEIAKVNQLLYEMYKRYGLINKAITTADSYVRSGSEISSYLGDRKDDAIAFSASLRSSMGITGQIAILKDLVIRKPQNYEFRATYADALANNSENIKAIEILKEGQRILKASNSARADYTLRIAEYYNNADLKDSANRYLQPFLNGAVHIRYADELRYIRLLCATGYQTKAASLLKEMSADGDNFYLADYYYTCSKLMQAGHQIAESMALCEKALQFNPYHLQAYKELMTFAKSKTSGKK